MYIKSNDLLIILDLFLWKHDLFSQQYVQFVHGKGCKISSSRIRESFDAGSDPFFLKQARQDTFVLTELTTQNG